MQSKNSLIQCTTYLLFYLLITYFFHTSGVAIIFLFVWRDVCYFNQVFFKNKNIQNQLNEIKRQKWYFNLIKLPL